jgi:hypothetical protein
MPWASLFCHFLYADTISSSEGLSLDFEGMRRYCLRQWRTVQNILRVGREAPDPEWMLADQARTMI